MQKQVTHYYSFGMSFAESTDFDLQPYKYNRKELGLNLYDYSARQVDNTVSRFTSINPLAEKYYSVSPYAYVANNPLKYIDPDRRNPVTFALRRAETVRSTYRITKAYVKAKVSVSSNTTESIPYNHYVEGDRYEEVANSLINRANLKPNIKSDAQAATWEQLKEGKKREKASQKENSEIEKKHNNMLEKNLPGLKLDNGGGPKRPLDNKEKIIVGTLATIGIFEQLSNPDPSSDTHQAHQENTIDRSKDKEQKNWIELL